MSGRATAEVSAARWRTTWRMHERGDGQRAIARFLGVSLKTVQYYLAKGRPDGLSDALSDGLKTPFDRRRRPSRPLPGNVVPIRRAQ